MPAIPPADSPEGRVTWAVEEVDEIGPVVVAAFEVEEVVLGTVLGG